MYGSASVAADRRASSRGGANDPGIGVALPEGVDAPVLVADGEAAADCETPAASGSVSPSGAGLISTSDSAAKFDSRCIFFHAQRDASFVPGSQVRRHAVAYNRTPRRRDDALSAAKRGAVLSRKRPTSLCTQSLSSQFS